MMMCKYNNWLTLISSYHIKSLVQEFDETSYRTLHSKHKSKAESEISRSVGSAMFAERGVIVNDK